MIQILKEQFGYQNVKVQTVDNNPFLSKIPAALPQDRALSYKSLLGTPVYTNLQIQSGSWFDPNIGIYNLYEGMILDAILMTVSMEKNIVKTIIQGRSGSVKEYISDGDYTIAINGMLVGNNVQYPSVLRDQLKEILDVPAALKVTGNYLNGLGVQSIVVKDYSFPQKSGGYSYQLFTINAISDIPLILKTAPKK